MHRKTATEIMMGQEREYREDNLSDMEQAQRESGHPNVMSYYHVLKTLPRHKGVLQEAKRHVSMLELFDAPNHDMYYSEKDEFFVDNWSIQTPELYHRHKELGTYQTMDGMAFWKGDEADAPDHYTTHIMWDAAGGECGLCGEHMSGEIMMMHKFYQMP